jgi:hypothetical protein
MSKAGKKDGTQDGDLIMATTLEIVNGISQAMANTHDGALDEKGEPVKTGFLRREEEVTIHDRRLIDGFSVAIYGTQLCLKYHSEMRLKEVHANSFETDMESMLKDCAGFLKKQYKSVTGEGLSLTAAGDPDIMVQSTSRVRSWVQAKQHFDIGGMDESTEMLKAESEDRLDDAIKDWLAIGKDKFPKTKKPENVSGKRDEEPRA